MCADLRCVLISVLLIVTVAWPLMSFKRVHTLESALDWNFLTQEVSPIPLNNGLHYMGAPWHSLIKYPKTMQNMEFSTADSPHDELHCRTVDGLEVILEVTYQYQIITDEIYKLYSDFDEDHYTTVFFDVASHLISEAAADYTAYEFFNSKEAIALAMTDKLDAYFSAHLHATIISLQIQNSILPVEFNTAITNTVTQRQNITNAEKYLEQMEVLLDTQIIIAQKNANMTLASAAGEATQITLSAEAASVIYTQNGNADAAAYANAKRALALDNDELLQYIWWDIVEGASNNDASLLVGISPTTFLKTSVQAT